MNSFHYLRISDDIEELNDVRSTREVLQDLDLSLDLLLLDWFQYFDDAFLIGGDIDSFKDFRVLSTSYFSDDFIVILAPV
jgi:hypothetical protein